MYSEATACIRQLMCTAVSQLSSDQVIPLHVIMVHICFALHVYFLYITCKPNERVLCRS
jgi:hypothetical protein